MQHRIGVQILLFSAIAGCMMACLEPASYPDEPTITFNSFTPNGDRGLLVLDFTDGDGNIGLDQADTTGVNCLDTCLFYYNFFCEYYELQNGEWVHIPLDWEDGLAFFYRIPRVEPSGQNPALNGELQVFLEPQYYLVSDFDTLRYEIYIVDRDLNASNTIVTPPIVKP